jgi:GT2 family glycosyltransferase
MIFPMTQEDINKKTVCAVVVTYNRVELLQESIEAHRNQTRTPDKILVVNNGSTDGTKAWLDEQKDLWVIHQENLGGAGGFHRGVREAHLAGYDWIWLMDDDCICEPDALRMLLEAKDVLGFEPGFLCSRVLNDDSRTVNAPDLDMRVNEIGGYDYDIYLDHGLLKVRRASFVSVMVPRTIVSQCGLPIPEMFIWGDDGEYTSRITLSHSAYWAYKSRVNHKRVKSHSRLDILIEDNENRIKMFRYFYRNYLYYMKKNYGTKAWLSFIKRCIADIFKVVLSGKQISHKLSAIWTGFWQSFLFLPKIEFPLDKTTQ